MPIKDHRIYKEFVLPNYMEVLVVSDPLTTTSSAAISVGVGTLQNPREINGLAHLLEHTLFLGKHQSKTSKKMFIRGFNNALNGLHFLKDKQSFNFRYEDN